VAWIYKSSHCEILDDYFSQDLADRYGQAIGLLDSNPGLLSDTTENIGRLRNLPEQAAQRIRSGRRDFDNLWINQFDPAGQEMRRRYRDAIETARGHDPPKPLKSWWVSDPGGTFEIRVSDNDAPREVVVQVWVPRNPPGGMNYIRQRGGQEIQR
jgi:hypothetical protein